MASKHRGCTRRRHYTTCKKKRSCKWVKRGKSHKGYCKKRTMHRRKRGGSIKSIKIQPLSPRVIQKYTPPATLPRQRPKVITVPTSPVFPREYQNPLGRCQADGVCPM